MAVWFGWYFLFGSKAEDLPVQENKPAETAVAKDAAAKPESAKTETAGAAVKSVRKGEQIKEEKFDVSNGVFKKITFSNRGARIENLSFGERNIELVAGKKNVETTGVIGWFDFPVYFNEKEFLSGSPLDDAIWKIKNKEKGSVSFATVTELFGSEVEIEKIFSFGPADRVFNVSYKIKNLGKNIIPLPNGKIYISAPDFVGPELPNYTGQYNAVTSIHSIEDGSMEKGEKGKSFFSSGPATDTKSTKGNVKWTGVMGRYFVALIMPDNFKAEEVVWNSIEKVHARSALFAPVTQINANEVVERSIKVVISEKDKVVLEKINPVLIPASDVSKWVEPIRNGLIICLSFINKLFGNLGVSLIIFSIITKLIFLPLTQKSTKSMKKMSALSPKIAELKIKYKDKPDVMQREIMGLYKKEGVNPLGGCLPLLIQMPFFIALYSALNNSLDMWQAPFMLWIKDLSEPDTVGHLLGIPINIMPILMTVTMFFQQKLTTVDTGGSTQQQMIMKLMPVMFIFIFWSMPSGLVIYWTVQNTLQIAHSLIVMKMPSKKKA